MSDSPDPIDQLLTVPPAEFVSTRNRFVSALRRTDAALAATIKALPKPSPSVWGTNQIARRAPDRIARYLAASDALERAQSGPGGSDESRKTYQAALATQRETLDGVVTAVRDALDEAKLPTNRDVLDRVTNDLRWAVLDPEARRLLQEGRLLRDLEPPDFASLVGRIPLVDRPRATPSPAAPSLAPGTTATAAPARPKAEDGGRLRADQKRRLDALTARHATAREQVAHLREARDEAREALAAAEKAIATLRKEMAAAERKAAQAARAHDEAEATLAERSEQLARLEEELAAASGK
jgi:hypothetical protein